MISFVIFTILGSTRWKWCVLVNVITVPLPRKVIIMAFKMAMEMVVSILYVLHGWFGHRCHIKWKFSWIEIIEKTKLFCLWNSTKVTETISSLCKNKWKAGKFYCGSTLKVTQKMYFYFSGVRSEYIKKTKSAKK